MAVLQARQKDGLISNMHVRLLAGVVGALYLCGSPPLANAQLMSFARLRCIELDQPLPGTEKAHKEFTAFLQSGRVNLTFLQPPSKASDLSDFDALGFARCTVRTDLVKPRSLGLECRDRAGRYVGTLRARRMSELRDILRHYRSGYSIGWAPPYARPLNQYAFIYVAPWEGQDQGWISGYIRDLLKADGAWQVVDSADVVPPGDRDRVLTCKVTSAFMGPNVYDFTVHVSLDVRDSSGQIVRSIDGSSILRGSRAAVRDAVRRLLEAQRADEEIYRPLPAGTPEPKLHRPVETAGSSPAQCSGQVDLSQSPARDCRLLPIRCRAPSTHAERTGGKLLSGRRVP